MIFSTVGKGASLKQCVILSMTSLLWQLMTLAPTARIAGCAKMSLNNSSQLWPTIYCKNNTQVLVVVLLILRDVTKPNIRLHNLRPSLFSALNRIDAGAHFSKPSSFSLAESKERKGRQWKCTPSISIFPSVRSNRRFFCKRNSSNPATFCSFESSF